MNTIKSLVLRLTFFLLLCFWFFLIVLLLSSLVESYLLKWNPLIGSLVVPLLTPLPLRSDNRVEYYCSLSIRPSQPFLESDVLRVNHFLPYTDLRKVNHTWWSVNCRRKMTLYYEFYIWTPDPNEWPRGIISLDPFFLHTHVYVRI